MFKTALGWNKSESLRPLESWRKSPSALSLIESEGSRTMRGHSGQKLQVMSIDHRIARERKAFPACKPHRTSRPRNADDGFFL